MPNHRMSPQPETVESNTGKMQQPVEQDDAIDLVELFYRLLNHWKLIIALALIFAVGAGAYSKLTFKPVYQATSVIYVVNRDDSVINVSDLQIGAVLTYDYIRVFDMWEVHEGVISKLGLSYNYGYMRSHLSVTNPDSTRMIDITVTSPDPQQAAAIANTYAQVACEYIEANMFARKPSVMSVALVPTNPINANGTRTIMLGFIGGALLGAAFVFIQMMIDDKYKTADDIRKYTGLAVLAAIPNDASLGDDGKAKKTGSMKKKNGGEKA